MDGQGRRTNKGAEDGKWRNGPLGVVMQGGLESGERYATSAKVHGLDIKVIEEFKKFGLEQRCRNICDDLGIERYDDLKWVSTEMVQEYQTKPVEREKLKALVSSYHSCQDRGVPSGAGREYGRPVEKPESVRMQTVAPTVQDNRMERAAGGDSGLSCFGEMNGGFWKVSAREVLVGAEGRFSGSKAAKQGDGGVPGFELEAGGGADSCSVRTGNEGRMQLQVSGGGGLLRLVAGKQGASGDAGLELAVERNGLRSVKKCPVCHNNAHRVKLADAVEFLEPQVARCWREFYRKSFLNLSLSPLSLHQIDEKPYQEIRNEVRKEIEAFILKICKKDVIVLREQGYDVSCLLECRKCKERGSPKYMYDRAQRGKYGEILSQRETGFSEPNRVRENFWRLVSRCNEKVEKKQNAC